jgi:hypothetical protein
MEDVDIPLQPRKLFKDNPPLRLSDNFAASWCNVCHVPAGMLRAGNPPVESPEHVIAPGFRRARGDDGCG